MEPSGAAYLALYAISLSSVVAIVAATLALARRTGTSLSVARLLLLSKDEGERLKTSDPVFLMHLSIALGVGLSILIAVLDPLLPAVAVLRDVLLALTIPLVAGLLAAGGWRVQRYLRSKRVERELLHTGEQFSAASTWMQLILILAIALTTSELVLAWFPSLVLEDFVVGVARNSLVVLYYVRPSVNLIRNFDVPQWSMRTPFKLADVMEGKVDPSSVSMGADKVSDFTERERLSYNSCVEIGACESACPATAAGRTLSPRILVRELSLLERQGGMDAATMSAVKDDELWSCTSCGACVQSCPVAVKHVDLIYDLRRNLVNAGKLDKEKSALLQNLTQTQNPYGFEQRSRGDWASAAGVPTFSSNPDAEYLFWVGCVASFDQRAQSVARALSKVLKSAGVSFAILGTEEVCTGDPARRLGEEGRYQELAMVNIERMNALKVKKVVTTCPHCFNSIRNEYPQFGGNYEVVHHTQLISDLIREGRLKVSPEKVKELSVTLHDACYAARYNNIFDEPRAVLDATGADVREMHRRKEKTFCCGAGGSNYWYKVPQQKSIAGIRTEEAVSTGARTIATECPFCLSMFEDSTKVSGAEMDVRDVAEIIADSIIEAA